MQSKQLTSEVYIYNRNNSQWKQGCILNLEFIFPPPFFIYIFPQKKLITNRGCSPQAKNVQPFFAILSRLGEKYAYFLPIGEKIWISSPFSSPFNNFFPPTRSLAIFLPRGGGGQNYSQITCWGKKIIERGWKKEGNAYFFPNW